MGIFRLIDMLKNNMLRIVAISAAALFPVAANASNTVLVCTVKASDFQKIICL